MTDKTEAASWALPVAAATVVGVACFLTGSMLGLKVGSQRSCSLTEDYRRLMRVTAESDASRQELIDVLRMMRMGTPDGN